MHDGDVSLIAPFCDHVRQIDTTVWYASESPCRVQVSSSMPSYPAVSVANSFIELSTRGDFRVDPMKLQKLVYVAHGWNLVRSSRPLIIENVEAWPYGPVVPALYYAFRDYRSADVDAPAPLARAGQIDGTSLTVVEEVWSEYGSKTAIELSMMTHEQGYAWDLARKSAEPWDTRPIIPQSFIKDEFRRRLRMA